MPAFGILYSSRQVDGESALVGQGKNKRREMGRGQICSALYELRQEFLYRIIVLKQFLKIIVV